MIFFLLFIITYTSTNYTKIKKKKIYNTDTEGEKIFLNFYSRHESISVPDYLFLMTMLKVIREIKTY